MKQEKHLNLWKSVVYTALLVFLSIGYFIALSYFASSIPKFIYGILDKYGRLIYFMPLVILLIYWNDINIKAQLFKPKIYEIVITIFSAVALFSLFFAIKHFTGGSIKEKNYVFSELFGVLILAPILEEVFFRGIILHQLLKRYRKLLAISFSTFLFVISHLNLLKAFSLLLFSVLISILYIRFRKSLVIAILFHSIWNALNIFLG